MKRILVSTVALMLSGIGNVVAMEATAPQGHYGDENTLEMRIDVQAQWVQDILAKDAVCNATAKYYDPTNAAADGNGCVETAFTTCARAGKIYAPNNGARDGNNCISIPTIGLPICPNGSGIISTGSTWVCG